MISPGGFTAESLAGLTPEQVATIAQVDTQREALRQRGVGGLIDAANLESEIALRETSGELNREQASRIRRLAQYDSALAKAELDQRISQVEENRAQTEARRTLLPEQVAEARANAAQSRAAAAASASNAALARERADQERQLFPLKLQEAQLDAKGVDIVDQITGRTVNIPRSSAASYLAQQSNLLATTRERRIDNARQAEALKLNALKDDRTRRTAVAEAESKILQNADTPEHRLNISPYNDLFNELADTPYVYIYFPDAPGTAVGGIFGAGEGSYKGYSDVNKKVDLPPLANGARVTARDVYEAAQAYPGGAISVREYLEKEYFPNKVGGKAPWLP